MRLDKYLKVSRIIKRRTVAKEACEGGRVSINGKVAKPSTNLKEDDIKSYVLDLVKKRSTEIIKEESSLL